jgi:NADH pyrophosphatase NudC (nudix superfamily)
MPNEHNPPRLEPVESGSDALADDVCRTNTGEHWRWCPRCGHELHNHKCKLVCPRCGYFMSCSDFD